MTSTCESGQANRINQPLFVIGRAEDCDLVLKDPQFSDYHAYVLVRDGQVTLRHLGVAPKVAVNGRWMQWGELCHGDRIRTGPYEFTLRVIPACPSIAQPELEAAFAESDKLAVFSQETSTAIRRDADARIGPLGFVDEMPDRVPGVRWNNASAGGPPEDWW